MVWINLAQLLNLLKRSRRDLRSYMVYIIDSELPAPKPYCPHLYSSNEDEDENIDDDDEDN